MRRCTVTNTANKPGYYGVKGTDVIMQALFALFLETSIVNIGNVKPLTPIEFIQQILVPETGIRLIQQDRDGKIDLKEAKQIMKESEEYGSIVYYKAKKEKTMENEKQEVPPKEEQDEEKPSENITFSAQLTMPSQAKTEDGDDDGGQPDDLFSSQLSMASQGDKSNDLVSSQVSESQE